VPVVPDVPVVPLLVVPLSGASEPLVPAAPGVPLPDVPTPVVGGFVVPDPVGAHGVNLAVVPLCVLDAPVRPVDREVPRRFVEPVVPVALAVVLLPVVFPSAVLVPVVFPLVAVVEELPDAVVPGAGVDPVVPVVELSRPVWLDVVVELVTLPARAASLAPADVAAPAGSHGAVVGAFAPGVPGSVPLVPVVPGVVVCVCGVAVVPVLCAAAGTPSATASAAAAVAATNVLFTSTSSVSRHSLSTTSRPTCARDVP